MMKEYELTKLRIEDLKTDGDNPNVVTEEELEAIKENIKKYGFLVPIVVDKDNVIADGEHRVQAYGQLGMKEIPAYKLNISVADRKLLRQVLNKLRGTHDLKKDIGEFKTIMEKYDDSSEIVNLLPKDDIKFILDKIESQGLYSEKEIDESLATEQRCPKCGYQW